MVSVGPSLEVHLDRGDLLDRVGAHLVDALDSAERVLDRDRDQLLDLGRRVTGCEGLHLDDRRGELGKHVRLRVAGLEEPEQQERRGTEDGEPPEPQATSDYPTHYCLPPSVFMDAG